MSFSIASKSSVSLGVVPTHLTFSDGLVPDPNRRIPRDPHGTPLVVANMRSLCARSRVRIDCVQLSLFPGLNQGDAAELVAGLKEIGLAVHLIIMVDGADPMDPDDEDAVVKMLVDGLQAAEQHGAASVSSTSIEQWMKPGAARKEGGEFEAAIAQTVTVHLRALEESGVRDLTTWNIEFLRGVEFQTFTDLGRCWQFVVAANQALGRNVFKVLVDAAHCGDSGLSVSENVALIDQIAAAESLGMFHASAKTTRGCLTTDEGWSAALLAACARTGALETVLVELFHHEDPALESLRAQVVGHGVDTRDGRSYDELVLDGLATVGRTLNNLNACGYLD